MEILMGTGIVSGINWSVEGGVFSFFGQRGYVDGKKWTVPSGFGALLVEVDPDPIGDHICAIIAQDEQDGNADKIAYIGVQPFAGLLLALEGVLTLDTLCKAEETPDRIICTIVLNDVERTLIVLKNASTPMATYDSNNEIV